MPFRLFAKIFSGKHCRVKDNPYLCAARLTEHLKLNRKDYSTERALTMLVGKRRALLDYLKDRDIERYRAIVKELGLRK